MLFTSWEFLALFSAVLVGLRVMPTRESRQVLVLLAGVVFYAAGTPWHLLVLATPAVVDYACAIRIEESEDPRVRRRWLLLSVVSNLGLLAYFKYADFFVDNVAALLHVPTAPLDIALPIGISFFIFKTLSYTIDVYRRDLAACRSWWRYALFVGYFPELVAGPIVRASIFLPQLTRSLAPSLARAGAGLQLALLGVTKKWLIADRLAVFVDPVFSTPAAYSQGTVASAVVAYSLQIYCDFSGYSDMAIGISRVIGFDLPENFDMPYRATSITDFWRRWHITLSTWLRDYLYIPLGGNRKGELRTYINLMVTMLLGGLWHGASWTFVFWGFLHGAGLAAHKLWRRHVPPDFRPFRGVVGWATTYAFVCVGWVFFRAADFPTAAFVLRKIAGLEPGGVEWFYLPLWLIVPVVVAAHIAAAMMERRTIAPLTAVFPRSAFGAAFVVAAWLVGVFLLTPLRTSPFIYFRF
jgi:alginate O-acetyltransferase complex protein AlgI